MKRMLWGVLLADRIRTLEIRIAGSPYGMSVVVSRELRIFVQGIGVLLNRPIKNPVLGLGRSGPRKL